MSNTDNNPQNGLQGSSYIYRLGTSPNTRAVVSQKVRVLAPAYGGNALYQIGVMASVNPSESRTIEPVRGIGFGDIIAELVPSNTEAMSVSTERTLLYLSNIWQSTGYAAGVDGPVRSLRHHRWPFDVEQQIVFSRIADSDLNIVGTDRGRVRLPCEGLNLGIQFHAPRTRDERKLKRLTIRIVCRDRVVVVGSGQDVDDWQRCEARCLIQNTEHFQFVRERCPLWIGELQQSVSRGGTGWQCVLCRSEIEVQK